MTLLQQQQLQQQEVAGKLNLARHAVRGTTELNPKQLWASADLRGYRAVPPAEYFLVNFWRTMPPESAEETPHLTSAPRQHSMFWRQLRPELVVHNTGHNSIQQNSSSSSGSTTQQQQQQQQALREPLSPDAGGLVTAGCSDWEQQIEGVQRATHRLITQVHYYY
jgi:hypothetical protein